MEDFLNLVDKFKLDESLFTLRNIQSLSCEDVVNLKENIDWKLEIKINIEYDLSYDKLYHGAWSDVPEERRRIFQVLSFLKAYCVVKDPKQHNFEQLQKALHVLDVAIMIGTGLEESNLLTEFAQQLHEFLILNHPIDQIECVIEPQTLVSSDKCEIEIVDQPSEETFWTKYFHLHKPVKLTNCINNWPAMSKWSDLNYFMSKAGYRTVPIELGKKYDNDDWSQGMFRFGEFLNEFMSASSSSGNSGYLAQHDLFDQIPLLREDIAIPDYCAVGSGEPVIKSWIGPTNTISTMHTDDKHNLLCQVMGEKLVIIASPKDAQYLYTYEGLLNNTSQVDPENLDFSEFPLARNVEFFKLILKAGEMLYLPKLWFHYVRSLTPSISVSFWFDVEDR